jgi:LysR family glycine cleavage system transcriptional activator
LHNEDFFQSFNAQLEMPSALPPLESLRMLACCVRHKSFTHAASELCLTPSAVSLRIRSLEAQLGATFFVRHGPKIAATDQALQLAGRIDEALSTIASALDHCRSQKRALRVTCAPTFASRWLLPRLPTYHALPDSQPIAFDATATLMPWDKYDVAIRSSAKPLLGSSTVELLPDQGTPMLSPLLMRGRNALSPRQLLKLPLIPDSRWTRWFQGAGLPDAKPTFCRTRFATYELEAMAAIKGMGVALLSPFLYDDLKTAGTLVAPFNYTVEGPNKYWAVWRKGAPTPHFVRWIQHELARMR